MYRARILSLGCRDLVDRYNRRHRRFKWPKPESEDHASKWGDSAGNEIQGGASNASVRCSGSLGIIANALSRTNEGQGEIPFEVGSWINAIRREYI